MTHFARITAAAGAAFVAGTVGASAALLDFTDSANFSSTGSIAGVNYDITAFGGGLTFNGGTGPGPIATPSGTLAGDGDGLGVGDDEISLIEAVIITFDFPVFVDAIYTLDFFAIAGDNETAVLSDDGTIVATLTATADPASDGFGGFFAGADYGRFSTERLIVPAGPGNDDRGVGDFALAGLDVAPVPLPAGVLLLGTALAGLGLARRRRS